MMYHPCQTSPTCLLSQVVDDTEVVVMRGSYSYVGPDGQTYVVDWTADEHGFHPSAAHIPQPVQPNHPEVAAAVRAQVRG